MNLRLLVSLAFLGLATAAFAEDWPGFRGPDRTGVSSEKGLLKKWPDQGPALRWTYKDAGQGFSSVAVVNGVVYTIGSRKTDETILALDLKTGKEIWAAKVGPLFTFKGNQWGDGPRSTPTLDGKYLYALGGDGDLVCVDITQKGKEVWRTSFKKNYGGDMMTEWGYSESPLVDGDKLICTPGGNGGTVIALDKTNGNLLWRTKDLTDKAPYTSPVVAELQGVRQYIQMSYNEKGGYISGIEAKTGKVLWNHEMFAGTSYNVSSNAIPNAKANEVYYSNGNGHGSGLLKIEEGFKVENVYSGPKSIKTMKNNHGGVLKIGKELYGHSENSMWVCQDWKTGKAVWQDRNQLSCVSGTLTAADGLLILLTDGGEVALAKDAEVDGKRGLEVISKFDLPNKPDRTSPTNSSAKTWAYPVISNGCLFIRDQDFVYCYEVK